MTSLFITIHFFDLVDIFCVAFLIYYIYILVKDSVALNIFIGLFLIYLFWLVIRALNMELMSSLLGQFLGVGVLALIVVFQQEIRQFLLLIGSNERVKRIFSTDKLFNNGDNKTITSRQIKHLVEACDNMSKTKTGALIIIAQGTMLGEIIKTGEVINARISDSLIETIFFKNSPLHDGAMVIVGNRITAARCILPVTDRPNINPNLGLRHRAAIGITDQSDAIALIVSEERGKVSICHRGDLQLDISGLKLASILNKLMTTETNPSTKNGK